MAIAEAAAAAPYDAIALPGGMPGAEHLRDSAPLTALLKAQRAAGRVIGAVCASPAVVLVAHGLLTAADAATCHPNFTSRLPNPTAAARRVVVDAGGTLVTSRGPGTSLEFALQLVATLDGAAAAAEVAAPMVMHDGVTLA